MNQYGPREAHPTDEELQRIADLEPVEAEALSHAESCDVCSARLADLALAGLDANVALRLHADALVVRETVRSGATLPILLALAVAALASLPLLRSSIARLEHLRLTLEGLEHMTQPVLRMLSNPTTQIVAAAAAMLLCVLVFTSIRRLSPSPAGDPS
jgi:hypothetical protein